MSSDSDDDFNNGKDRPERRRQAAGVAGLIISILALSCVIGLGIWHTLVFNSVEQGTRDREATLNELVDTLVYTTDQLNTTVGYLQTQVAMQGMTGNSTILETGVCTLVNGKINFPNNVLADTVNTGQLVNYTVIERDRVMYVILSNFSTPVAVTSYTTDRLLYPSFPGCDALHPEVVNLVTMGLEGCTQDPTGASFTQSLMNDVQLFGSRLFILKSEQAKFELAGNTRKYFGPPLWWIYPPHCYENQYAVYYNEIFFVGALTNTYIFNIALANASNTFRITEPVMLLLTSSDQQV